MTDEPRVLRMEAPQEPAMAAPAQPDHTSLNPGLEQDIVRQRQEVDALEQYLDKLPPDQRMVVAQDIQAAKNAHSAGQLADATLITRISQSLGDQEMRKALQVVGEGALGLSVMVGGIASGMNGLSEGLAVSRKGDDAFKGEGVVIDGSIAAGINGASPGLAVTRDSDKYFHGDNKAAIPGGIAAALNTGEMRNLLGSFGILNDIPQGVETSPERLGTLTMADTGIGAMGIKQEKDRSMSLSA